MSRTKTRKARQRPAPPRRAKASRKEVRVLIPGHALGDRAFLLMRRRAGRWSVTDSFRGKPAYVGAGEVWRELEPDTAEAELYCWTEARARALVARFVAQAVEIARNNRALDAAFEAAETARRLEELAAAMVPEQVVPEVVNLQYMGEQLLKAQAEVAARIKRRAPVEDTITAPAPMDHPDYQPRTRDTSSLQQPLTLLGASIPANWEDPTVPIQQFPPKPDMPPTVHLKHLTESAPTAGEGARASVAKALAPDLVH